MTIFSENFNEISHSITYDSDWENETGYLDFAVEAKLDLGEGERVKTVTHNGRRVIITGTCMGNVVTFERYKGSDDIIVCNTPTIIETLLGIEHSRPNDHQVDLLTKGDGNIGRKLQSIVERKLRQDGWIEPVQGVRLHEYSL